MKTRKSNKFWGAMIVILILSAYIVPYTVLSNVQAWYGSFLFWGVIGIFVIIGNIMVTRDWRE